MKETPRRRKIVRSSLNEISTGPRGNSGVESGGGVRPRGLQRDIVYLGWPIATSNVSPNAGEGGELRGLSQWVQLYTGAKINFGDLVPYLIYGVDITPPTEKGKGARRRVYRHSSLASFAGVVGPLLYPTGPCRLCKNIKYDVNGFSSTSHILIKNGVQSTVYVDLLSACCVLRRN